MKRLLTLIPALLLVSPLALVGADGPKAQVPGATRYILLNVQSPTRQVLDEIRAAVPPPARGERRVGFSFIVSYLAREDQATIACLKNGLDLARETGMPVFIWLDGEYWWQHRPDLWNWWDPTKPGFDPRNKENVEWFSWNSDDALKISWLNWGRQIRMLPPPNLMSPRYRAACHEKMRLLMPIILDWWKALPADQRHLLAGVKVGWESSIGVNTFYYPNGNDLLDKPADEDPRHGIKATDVPARGLVQLGYAAVKTAGIRTEGEITEADLAEVARRHMEDLARLASELGVPRDRLYTHGAGWKEKELLYGAAVNPFSCPGWSFYRHAGDPSRDAGVQEALARSDAPYWGAVEWLHQGPRTVDAWRDALEKTLADPRCRLICIVNWSSIKDDAAAHEALAALNAADAPVEKPNIIVILADDLGYGDVQCYNPQCGKIPTPRIDTLASQGMRFTDGHSSSGVCSPSRYALLTGRYHWRTRLQNGIVGVFGEPLIAPDRMTLGTLAKQHGYRTAAIGKWHLGWDWPIAEEQRALLQAAKKPGKDDEAKPDAGAVVATGQQLAAWRDIFSKPIAGGPTTRGFDTYFGTDVPNWPPYCFIENDRTLGIPSEFLPAANFARNLASQQGPALKGWKLEDILPTLGERAAAFIGAAARKPEPFLLYLPLTAPHTPLSVIEAWKNKSGLNDYADFVMQTDATVGRVLDALEKSGAADKTLVVFTSDNGCAPYVGAKALELMGHYPSGPLRGYKADAWEGGHRVPFIVRWPGTVKPASVCHQLAHQADLLRTFADILGTKLPDNAGEDSFSLLPLLRGEDKPIRANAVSASSGGTPAVRLGNWKYIPAPGSGGWGTGGDQAQPVQLYKLADDLGETNNLAAAEPGKVAEMKTLLEKLITAGRSSPGAAQTNDVKVVRYPRAAGRNNTAKTAK